MRLWTFQPLMAAATLDAGLPYRPRPDLCRRDGWAGEPGAVGAYQWMTDRLNELDPRPTPDALPVWAYATEPTDFMRDVCGSFLTLEVDTGRVLLSNLDVWDDLLRAVVLNGATIPDSEWRTCLITPSVGLAVQGVMWEIRPDDVLSVEINLPESA